MPSIVWENFTHFGILKMWFLTIHENNISRYLAMSGNFLNFWGLKMRFVSREIHVSRVPSFVWANFPCLQIFRMLAAWKCDFYRFVKPKFQGTTHKSGNFLNFWGLKMRCAVSCNSCCKDTKLRVINFPHFSSLKMRFLPIRGTNVLRYLAKSEEIFIFHA